MLRDSGLNFTTADTMGDGGRSSSWLSRAKGSTD